MLGGGPGRRGLFRWGLIAGALRPFVDHLGDDPPAKETEA
jgi:hypothetical protein